MQNYWNVFAHNYRNLAPPLKPGPEDVAVIEDALAHWRVAHPNPNRELNALLCGVTPALAELKLPARTRLLAAEHSEPMVRAIWPGDNAARTAVCSGATELARAWRTPPACGGVRHSVARPADRQSDNLPAGVSPSPGG